MIDRQSSTCSAHVSGSNMMICIANTIYLQYYSLTGFASGINVTGYTENMIDQRMSTAKVTAFGTSTVIGIANMTDHLPSSALAIPLGTTTGIRIASTIDRLTSMLMGYAVGFDAGNSLIQRLIPRDDTVKWLSMDPPSFCAAAHLTAISTKLKLANQRHPHPCHSSTFYPETYHI
mgnify:FL=1|jgi:hypothetical protein